MARASTRTAGRKSRTSAILINGTLLLICIIWTIPTFGLLVSSFRNREQIRTTGWWTVFPHRTWTSVEQVQLERGSPLDQSLQVAGATVTDEQLRAGVILPDGRQAIWANRRARLIDLREQSIGSNADFTLDNYRDVLGTSGGEGQNLGSAFITTLAVAVPATVIPILIAAFAAYGFAWMRFPGRNIFFACLVALLVVPLQVALIPILRDYTRWGINGTFLAMWLAHTAFGLPLATYLLFNYVSQLPREILESAFIDGASPFTIFTRLILPLSVPALASFAIFQYLWVWNDYLVALVFLGAQPNTQVLTMRLANMVGTRGQDWHLLTAGAFISMLVPLTIFFSLQRYFVRGLMAGSVKG